MKKETVKLIEEYSRNFQNYNSDRNLLKKIILKTSLTEKKAIIEYCEKQINKFHFYFLVRMILIFFLLAISFTLFESLKIIIPLICQYLFTVFIVFVLFKSQDQSSLISKVISKIFFGEKKVIYESLLTLEDILSSDNYYYPLACIDCSNFHGKKYEGNILVCAIHPHGLKNCPDFES